MKKLGEYTHSQLNKTKALLFLKATLVSHIHNYIEGYIYLENGKIHSFGEGEPPPTLPLASGTESINTENYIITPSFINAHSHVAMSFFRDIAHQQENMIHTLFFPRERKLDAGLVEALSYPSILSGLLSGTSTFADHYYFSEGVIKAFQNIGVKGLVGETIADLNGAFPSQEKWYQVKELIENWPYDTDQFQPVVAPHATDSVSASLLTEMATFAKNYKLPLHMHLSQTSAEREYCLNNYNMSPVHFAEKCGALGPHSLAIHLVSATEDDLKIIKNSQTVFGFTPVSEIIYEKLPLFDKILELEIPFALGTDCAASNDSADLLSEMKWTYLLARDRGYKGALIPKILASTTQRAAQVFAKDDWSQMKVGAWADLTFFEKSFETWPLQVPQENLVFSHSSHNVQHLMVNGEWILFQRQPTRANVEDLKKEFISAYHFISTN